MFQLELKCFLSLCYSFSILCVGTELEHSTLHIALSQPSVLEQTLLLDQPSPH